MLLKQTTKKSIRRKEETQKNQHNANLDRRFKKVHYHRTNENEPAKAYRKLIAPQCLDLNTYRGLLLRFLYFIDYWCLEKSVPIMIDFSKTVICESVGTMLTMATIDRVLHYTKNEDLITAIPPENVIANQVFMQIGLSTLLKLPEPNVVDHEDVVYWRCVSGHQIDTEHAIKTLKAIFSTYPFSEEAKHALAGGLTEAITNTSMHAYPSDDDKWPDELRGMLKTEHKYWNSSSSRWWMFAGVKDSRLSVVVYDAGIGIPRSIRHTRKDRKGWFQELVKAEKSLVSKVLRAEQIPKLDSYLIDLAMNQKKSRSNKKNRGKGMTDLKAFIDITDNGHLVVLSGSGAYYYSSSKEVSHTYKSSMRGTLITWSTTIDK